MPPSHCEKCGQEVIKARLQGGGDEVILDPRPRVFVRLHRPDRQIDAWLSSEALVEHAGICPMRLIRSHAGEVVVTSPPPANPPDPVGDFLP